MSVFAKSFRALVALMIAVPLGPGGLCCCLIGATDVMAAEAVAPAPTSCCSQPAVPAVPPAPEPPVADLDAAECDCPVRDAGFLPERVQSLSAVPPAPAVETVSVVAPAALGPIEAPLPPSPVPPPKIALHLALSVLIS